MALRYLRHAAFVATSLRLTLAQQSNIVPEDLRSGFQGSGTEVQVSYTNEAVNGFKDGTSFNKDGKHYVTSDEETMTDFGSCRKRTYLRPGRQLRNHTIHTIHHNYGRHYMPGQASSTLRALELQEQLRHHKHRHEVSTHS